MSTRTLVGQFRQRQPRRDRESRLPMALVISTKHSPVPDPNVSTPLINLPQEILIHIAKQLPVVLDVFVLRRTCQALYHRLGPSNGNLWYHFLNNKNGQHRRRFSHYQQDADYFGLTKLILTGQIHGCQLCLREVRHTAVDAYRGGLFYKTLCRNCARENFKEIWRLEDEYPNLKIHPNDRITWLGGVPFDDPTGVTGRWASTEYNMTSVRKVDLLLAIEEQIGPPGSRTNYKTQAKDAWEARYDKQIRFAHKRKESADIIVTLMTAQYTERYPELHWLMPPEGFSEYLYNALLWNLRPWLAPHYGDKAMPKFSLGDHMDELIDLYSESEELLPDLRQLGLRNACTDILRRELTKIPYPGQTVRKASVASPLIRYWLDSWLRARGYKGVPKVGKKDLRNTARRCPFCTPVVAGFNCTQALAVHVWCQHPEELEEEWMWIEGS
ncbi:hypothetical protein ABW20_dc0103658 [Dactylellina cionopaga]|nr:hypothetical protein ABW20_dc0103658 [Dactylellina cionopaga]